VKRATAIPPFVARTHRGAASTDPRSYFILKRVFDVTVAFLTLLLTVPLWSIAALAVRLTSPGPVLYAQRRVGATRVRRGGTARWEPTTFTMYKFRSMRSGAAAHPHQAFTAAFIRGDTTAMAALNGGSELYKLVDDDRVTPVGAFLRRTSLDELPQLINVLRGEMSLVGPRPAMPYEVEHYAPWHMRRFAAPPGITGYWQVYGRSTVSFDQMVEMDIAYIERRSFLFDLWILAATPAAVLRRRGAA
jgi:lipopolysaccharide/colanic/teichoic acid biosynthesis glycosyltransferase